MAAPAGLAASVAGFALVGAASGGGLILTIQNIITMTKLKLGIACAIVAAGVATPVAIQYQSPTQAAG